MLKDFHKQFPVLSRYTYANTAASGILYEDLMEWRQEHDLDFLIKGSVFRDTRHEFIQEVRITVGNFFNCPVAQVALIPNFSFGFNTLLEGLGKNKKVLLLENDYPSVNEGVEMRDFERCYVKIDENLESNIEEAIRDEKPDVLALSVVQYISGIKIDLQFLKRLKASYPSLLIIADGTQFCGTENFNFQDSGIDVLCASAYKWLLAGYGNGFMLFKKEVISKIYPKAFDRLQADVLSKEQQHLMNYFEPGHQDTLNYGSLKFSLDFLEEIGINTIEKQIKTLSEKAKQAFTDLNLLEDRVVKRKIHSNIFNIKGDEGLFKKLTANNILSAQRGKGIRLSFHFYNTEEDLKTIIQCLKT